MKKILCYALAVALTVTTAVVGLSPATASAAEMGSNRQRIETLKSDKKQAEYKEGEALVLFKSSAKPSTKASVREAMPEDVKLQEFWDFSAAAKKKGTAAAQSTKGRSLKIALVKSETLTTKQLIAKMKKRSDVQTAEPNYRLRALSVNDSYFNQQWGLENTGQNGGTPGKDVNAASKWDKGIKGSAEKVVAIVDTGVDYTHEDLKDNMWENTYQPDLKGEHGFDFINGDDDPMDDNGHGSHCAGIIGAKGGNGIGISGVNQNVKIMALKFLDSEGSGWGADEISAYHYINKALDLGVDIVAINNSWGGGAYSEIFAQLMDLVGEKGAVSVCAAGNSSNDNDVAGEYPSNIESPYKINVAAVNEKNELAEFSSYGKKTVDIAAPGADILSTVSYDCYNPSLYSEAKQKEISQKFNDYEGNDSWAVPEQSTFSSTGSATYTAERVKEEYFGSGIAGTSLKLSFKNMKKGECASVRVPYTLSRTYDLYEMGDENALPYVSFQAKVLAPKSNGFFNSSTFLTTDLPKGTEINGAEDLLFDYMCYGSSLTGPQNYWNHFAFKCGMAEGAQNPDRSRELVFVIQAAAAGDYTIYIDDVGLSKEKPDTAKFGKYDYYNGTSMATPFVTGAVALAAAETPSAGSRELISQVLSCVQEDQGLEDKVALGGSLELSKLTATGPRIGSISVNTAKKQITIQGSGFDASDLQVKINNQAAKIVKKTKNQVVIQDQNWINCVVTVSITGRNKTITKEEVYLVKGKSSYTKLENIEFPQTAKILATDGRRIYHADSMSDSISALDTAKKKEMAFEPVFTVEAEKLFKKKSSSMAEFDFQFGKDLVYADGRLYNVASYSEVGMSSGGGGDDFFFEEDMEIDVGTTPPAYSSKYKLLAFDTKTKKTINLGNLPSDMKRIDDWTLAAYNGRIYLIGGYDYSKKAVSKKVKIYSPATKKWTNGPSLPEGRAAGKALQTGNSLVYTLGYGAGQKDLSWEKQNCPANLVLRGNSWRTSEAAMEPYVIEKSVTRSGHEYNVYIGSIGLCAGGLVYAGVPAEGLGDTFTYNVARDSFAGTKYNHSKEAYSNGFTGIAAGGTLYGVDQTTGEACKTSISSGLVKVTAPKLKGGTISGANKSYMPGNKVTLKAKPKHGYFVKSLTVNGKKVKGASATIRPVSNQKVSASFKKGTYVSRIELTKKTVTMKAGSTYKLKAKVLPAKATVKKVSYTSSNKKYAEVTSKGTIKAKKAGIGKTVKITVKATDGSGKKAICKVKITK